MLPRRHKNSGKVNIGRRFHLRAGTNLDNIKDRLERGRSFSARGESNPNYRHGRYVKPAPPVQHD